MSAVLLDTTVVSALHPRRRGSPIRSFYEPHLRDRTLVLSFQTYAELWAWAEERRWGAAERARLETFLHAFVVLPFTFTLGQTWAIVMTEAKVGGRRLEAGDA